VFTDAFLKAHQPSLSSVITSFSTRCPYLSAAKDSKATASILLAGIHVRSPQAPSPPQYISKGMVRIAMGETVGINAVAQMYKELAS
jgi:hypothetical protein